MNHDHADPAHAGQLHHVELSATQFERAVSFWDWLLTKLGYDQKQDWEGGRSWVNGPMYLVLKQAENTDQPFERNGPGLDHLAFHTGSRKHVDSLTTDIRD